MFKNINGFLLPSFKSVLHNSISIFLSKSILHLSFFLLATLIVRKLGLAEFGKYSISISLYSIFELISLLGLDNFILREVSKDNSLAPKFLVNGLVLGLFSTAFFYLIVSFVSNLLFYPPEIKLIIYILSIALFPAFINTLCETLLISLQKAKYILYTSLLREAFMLLLSFVFLSVFPSLYLVMLAIIISRLIGGLVYIYFLAKNGIKIYTKIDPIFFKNIFKVVTAFALISILSNIFLEADILILSKTVAVAEVGIYSIAKKIMRLMFIFVYSIITALFPIISHKYYVSKEKFLSLYRVSFKVILLLSSFLVFITFLSVVWLIKIFFGKAFIDSVIVTKILIFSILPLSLSFLFSRFLIVSNRQNKDLLALCIGLLLFIIAGILSALKWSYTGMAFASVISITILFGIHYLFVKKYVISLLKA